MALTPANRSPNLDHANPMLNLIWIKFSTEWDVYARSANHTRQCTQIDATAWIKINAQGDRIMTIVTFEGGTLQVDAETVAAGLRITPEALRHALQTGSVTSLCEKGQDDDAGRFRMTFFSPTRRMRLVVDAQGLVLQHSSADYSRKMERPSR